MLPRWSRDGKYFCSKESGTAQVWKAPSGGGQAVRVTHGGGFVASESPDEKWLYFSGEGADSSLRRMPAGVAPVGRAYFGFSVSPDHKWILYAPNPSAKQRIDSGRGFSMIV
jgi:hypothetical protein